MLYPNLYSWKKELTFHFLWFNLPNFDLDQPQLSGLEQWILLLTEASEYTTIPSKITLPAVKMAFKGMELSNWEKDRSDLYQEYKDDIVERQQRVKEHYQKNNQTIQLHPDYLEQSAPFAYVRGWKVFMKNLGVYPKRKVQLEDVILEDVSNKVVFALFRHWCKEVKKEQGLEITIKNEQNLAKDYEKALREGILYLYTEEDSFIENKFGVQFRQELLAAKINVQLNLYWHFEYLLKNTSLFKSMQVLRATLAYLAANEVVEMKIDGIYRNFLNQAINLHEISPAIDRVETSKLVQIREDFFSNIPSQIRIVLKNLMGEMIPKLQGRTKNLPFYLQEATTLHDYEDLQKIIVANTKLFEM